MRILNLYIARSLVLTTAIAVGVLTFVMISVHLLKAFELLARGVAVSVLLRFMLYLLPEMLKFTIPLALLCAAVLVFSRLSADNEITAMRASGVGLWQIVSPALLLSVALSAVCLWLQTTVSPRFRYKADQLKRTEGVKNPLALIEPGRFVELPGYVIRVGRRDAEDLYDIHIYALNEDGRLTHDITAQQGRIRVDEKEQILHLSLDQATIADVGPKEGADADGVKRLASDGFTFPLDYGEELGRKALTRKLKYMDVPMIFGRIYIDHAEGKDTTPHFVQLHTRMAMAVSPFAFLLMGIPFGIRTRRAETSVGLLLSLLLALGFYTFVVLADGLKHQPKLHPEILVWLPNIAYQVGGFWALATIAKR